MKLSKAQLVALEAVEKGEVSKWYPWRYCASQKARPDIVRGAHRKTIDSLVAKGLIYLDKAMQKIGKLNPYDKYALTDAGRDALAAAKKINSEAQSPVDNKASSS